MQVRSLRMPLHFSQHSKYARRCQFSFSFCMVLLFYASNCTALIESPNVRMTPFPVMQITRVWGFKFAEGGTLHLTMSVGTNHAISALSNRSVQLLLCTDKQIGIMSSFAFFNKVCRADEIGYRSPCIVQKSIKEGSIGHHNDWNVLFEAPSTDWYQLFFANCPQATFTATANINAQNPGGEYLSLSEVPYPMLYTICTLVWVFFVNNLGLTCVPISNLEY